MEWYEQTIPEYFGITSPDERKEVKDDALFFSKALLGLGGTLTAFDLANKGLTSLAGKNPYFNTALYNTAQNIIQNSSYSNPNIVPQGTMTMDNLSLMKLRALEKLAHPTTRQMAGTVKNAMDAWFSGPHFNYSPLAQKIYPMGKYAVEFPAFTAANALKGAVNLGKGAFNLTMLPLVMSTAYIAANAPKSSKEWLDNRKAQNAVDSSDMSFLSSLTPNDWQKTNRSFGIDFGANHSEYEPLSEKLKSHPANLTESIKRLAEQFEYDDDDIEPNDE